MTHKKTFVLTTLFLSAFAAAPCFASSRSAAINQALDSVELASAPAEDAFGTQDLSAWDVKLRNRMEEGKPAPLRTPQKVSVPYEEGTRTEREQTVSQGNFYISGGYNSNHMHYKELDGRETLDENYGKLHGYYLNMGLRAKGTPIEEKFGDLFMEGYFRRQHAIITYDGALVGVPVTDGVNIFFLTLPFTYQEKQIVEQLGVKVGQYKQFPSGVGEGFAYVDLGQRVWRRGEDDMNSGILELDNVAYNYPVDEYAEKYYWTYFGFGAGLNLFILPRLTVGVDAEFMLSTKALSKMRANSNTGGGDTYTLGGVMGGEIQLPIKFFVLKNISIDVTPYFTYWHIKRSTPIWEGDYYYSYEPMSNTHIEGIRSGLTLAF